MVIFTRTLPALEINVAINGLLKKVPKLPLTTLPIWILFTTTVNNIEINDIVKQNYGCSEKLNGFLLIIAAPAL